MMGCVAKTADAGLMTLCRVKTGISHYVNLLICLYVKVTKNVLYIMDVKEEEKAMFVTAQKKEASHD